MPRTYCSYSLPVLTPTQYRLRIGVQQVFQGSISFYTKYSARIWNYWYNFRLSTLRRPRLPFLHSSSLAYTHIPHRRQSAIRPPHRYRTSYTPLYRYIQHRLQDQTNRYLFQGMNELQDILHLRCYHQPLSWIHCRDRPKRLYPLNKYQV